MARRRELVIIDPQIDFCAKFGSLYVQGADEDNLRAIRLLEKMGDLFYDLHVTLDSHHLFHIANPPFWRSSRGNHPDPFTLITAAEVEAGEWMTTIPGLQRRALDYVRQLEKNDRYKLVIWPPHCLIGSEGHAVMPDLFQALLNWEQKNIAMVNYVSKGSNLHTEHYSAVRADVVDLSDPTTQLNTRLVQMLEEAEDIYFFGQARSHCLANTMRDIADSFSDPQYIRKMVLVTDCTSDVPGFENLGEDFVRDMTARGMRTVTSTELLA
jgi:nicotinamidase/pyrazinamidase